MKYILCTLITSLLTIQLGITQKSIIINNKKLYVKSTTNVNTQLKHFTVCSDLKLSKNCQNYFNSSENEYTSTIITQTDINSIIKTKGVGQIKNISTEKIGKTSITPVLYRNNSVAYFIGHGKNLNIIEYTAPIKSIGRSSSPENIACRGDCYETKIMCWDDCIKASQIGNECWDGCNISYIGCAAICDKYVKKIQIELKGILVKPISIKI